MWLQFNTETEAEQAEFLITQNIRKFCEQYIPQRVSAEGLLSIVNGEVSQEAPKTTNWAIPLKTTQNKWVLVKPTQELLHQIPLEVAMNGVQFEAEVDNVDFHNEYPL